MFRTLPAYCSAVACSVLLAVAASAQPDIFFDRGFINPTAVEPGDAIVVDVIVGNQGAQPTDGFFIDFFISEDRVVSDDDVDAGFAGVTSIDPGETTLVSESFSFPQIPAGEYFLIAVADLFDQIPETDEGNNEFTIAFSVGPGDPSPSNGSVNVDFNASNSPTYFGVVAADDPGTYWNGVTPPLSTPNVLVGGDWLESDGETPSAIELFIGHAGGQGSGLPANDLFRDDFSHTVETELRFQQLQPGASYDIIFYATSSLRGGEFTFGSVSKSTSGGESEVFIEGVNWVGFEDLVANPDGEIEGSFGPSPSAPKQDLSRFNGFQIIRASDNRCPADTNGDGQVLPNDFTAWIQQFNTNGSWCDQNDDGLCQPNDFNAWIDNFNNGC